MTKNYERGSRMNKRNLLKKTLLLCTIFLLKIGTISACIVNLDPSYDTAQIQAVFSTTCPNPSEHRTIDGGNNTFSVYGTLELRGDIDITLKNARFNQTKTGDPDVRTLFKRGGVLNLHNIIVDRGNDERNGSISNSAGIWLEIHDSTLDSVEVTGDGYGTGLSIIDSYNVTMTNINVHDMRWSTPSTPNTEQIFGILILRSDDITLQYSRVDRLRGEYGSGTYNGYQSDGIAAGGTNRLFILSTSVAETGEGIDITGSDGNDDFEIAHSAVIDLHSFGFKFANTATNGIIRDSIAIRAGWAGFVFSGKNGGSLQETIDMPGPSTENILVDNCEAWNTGHNTNWPTQEISGFLVLHGLLTGDPDDDDYPANIHIKNSKALNDAEHYGTMEFGFYNEPNHYNTTYNTDSVGHSIEGNRYFHVGTP